MPVPALNVINGGSHAGNKLAMQEFMILPTGQTQLDISGQSLAEISGQSVAEVSGQSVAEVSGQSVAVVRRWQTRCFVFISIAQLQMSLVSFNPLWFHDDLQRQVFLMFFLQETLSLDDPLFTSLAHEKGGAQTQLGVRFQHRAEI